MITAMIPWRKLYSKRKLAFLLCCIAFVNIYLTYDLIGYRETSTKISSKLKDAESQPFSIANTKLSVIQKQQKESSLQEPTPGLEPTLPPGCAENKIVAKAVLDHKRTKCIPHQPSTESCSYTNRVYEYDIETHTCKYDPKIEICRYKSGKFQCSVSVCGGDRVKIHLLDPNDGTVKPLVENHNKDKKLVSAIKKYGHISVKNGYFFMFLSCWNDVTKTQFLRLDEEMFTDKKADAVHRASNGKISINLVMLDSVSRPHFYRSLKATVAAFTEINTDSSTEAEVLDFEKFQALYGHSAGNARALYNGDLFPPTLTDDEMERSAVGYDTFYEIFKKEGYRTLHQVDLCWTAIWGLVMDVGGTGDWQDLKERLENLGIDDTGLSFSACKMLAAHNLTHPFNTYDDEKLCYNGLQMDTYYLHYLWNRFSSAETSNRPLVAMTILNVDHDSGGLRLQTVDEDLAAFVRQSSKLDNTLTVLFADHGNTYTEFTYVDIEGQYEMFHPSMFLVIPPKVKSQLGHFMNVLRINQKRLVTMLDLHYGLKAVAHINYGAMKGKEENMGFLKEIPSDKWCTDLHLHLPNICLCDGWVTPMLNDTNILGILEFAVGYLNDKIFEHKENSGTLQGCKRLVPTYVENAMKRVENGRVYTSFEFHTSTDQGLDAIFKVGVSSLRQGNADNFDMKLEKYDRLSKYGPFRQCVDTGVDIRLCVCDSKHARKQDIRSFDGDEKVSRLVLHSTSAISTIFDKLGYESIETLIEGKLYVFVRTFREKPESEEEEGMFISQTFEVVNTSAKGYYVSLELSEVSGVIPVSTVNPVSVKAYSISYLTTLMQTTPFSYGRFKHDYFFREL